METSEGAFTLSWPAVPGATSYRIYQDLWGWQPGPIDFDVDTPAYHALMKQLEEQPPMPRPGPRRSLVNVRLSDEQTAALDATAADLGCTRSDLIRALLTTGLADTRIMRKIRATLAG